jgi:hypothetical protein
MFGKGASEAGRSAGDEPGFGGHVCFPRCDLHSMLNADQSGSEPIPRLGCLNRLGYYSI